MYDVVFMAALGLLDRAMIIHHGLVIFGFYVVLRTGLAGGDHLHFAILVGATYVDPKEWWDAKWVRDRLEPALASGSP